MQPIALDACCLVNLCAANEILGVDAPPGAAGSKPAAFSLKGCLRVPRQVIAETLFLLRPDPDDPESLVKTPIDMQRWFSAGAFEACDLEGPGEVQLFVKMAAKLGDGEAACFAIAQSRGWLLGTDDRRAMRLAAEADLPVITTAEMVRRWAEDTRASNESVAAVLRSIRRFARFAPRAGSPECDWWVDRLRDAASPER